MKNHPVCATEYIHLIQSLRLPAECLFDHLSPLLPRIQGIINEINFQEKVIAPYSKWPQFTLVFIAETGVRISYFLFMSFYIRLLCRLPFIQTPKDTRVETNQIMLVEFANCKQKTQSLDNAKSQLQVANEQRRIIKSQHRSVWQRSRFVYSCLCLPFNQISNFMETKKHLLPHS